MPESVQHLIGQLADGRFPLRKLLGVAQNSAVFLTNVAPDRPSDPPLDAAIKLIPEDPQRSEEQLARWRQAAALAHPGLLKILHSGRCTIDGSPCLYLVTELADEDLGQLLPQRALTSDEARGMLAPVLAALDFLHEKGLVHAGLKPSNIHATGDNVKLSTDRILPAGESSAAWPLAAPFAPPESLLFPASDIWSLGAALCETLTQRLPERQPSGAMLAPSLTAPFDEIVRRALIDDATERISLDEVRALLDPAFVPRRKPRAEQAPFAAAAQAQAAGVTSTARSTGSSATAAQGVATAAPAARATQIEALPAIDPLSVPLSPVSPNMESAAPSRARIPVTSLPQVNATIAGPRRASSPAAGGSRSNKLFLVSAVALAIFAAGYFGAHYLRQAESPASATSAAAPAPNRAASPSTPPSPAANQGAAANPSAAPKMRSGPVDLSTPPEKSASRKKREAAEANAIPARGSENFEIGKFQRLPVPAPASAANLSVVNKVLPEISEKARSTIQGTVRVNVRVRLNPDGSVSSAELDSPASSQFFAELALKAARRWQFAASDGGPVPASTVVRFDFTPTSTAAYLPK